MNSFRLFLVTLAASLGAVALPAGAACAVANEASNALVISTAPGCLSNPQFKAALVQSINRGMSQMQAQVGESSTPMPIHRGAPNMAVAELQPSPQERLRTLLYLNRIEAQMRNQAHGSGPHYYGQDD